MKHKWYNHTHCGQLILLLVFGHSKCLRKFNQIELLTQRSEDQYSVWWQQQKLMTVDIANMCCASDSQFSTSFGRKSVQITSQDFTVNMLLYTKTWNSESSSSCQGIFQGQHHLVPPLNIAFHYGAPSGISPKAVTCLDTFLADQSVNSGKAIFSVGGLKRMSRPVGHHR